MANQAIRLLDSRGCFSPLNVGGQTDEGRVEGQEKRVGGLAMYTYIIHLLSEKFIHIKTAVGKYPLADADSGFKGIVDTAGIVFE